MVSVGMSKLGYTHPVFVDPGVQINEEYYRNVLLSQELLPAIRQILGKFFHQDSAPAHMAGTQQSITNDAIDQRCRRLHACVRARGGHFEWLLWLTN